MEGLPELLLKALTTVRDNRTDLVDLFFNTLSALISHPRNESVDSAVSAIYQALLEMAPKDPRFSAMLREVIGWDTTDAAFPAYMTAGLPLEGLRQRYEAIRIF